MNPRILISYAYFDSPASVYNLSYFLKYGIIESDRIDFVLVINGHNCSVPIQERKNLTVMRRDNIGYDFGAHNAALKNKGLNYDYYIFLNSGVIGPLIKGSEQISESDKITGSDWTELFISKLNDVVKLVGTTVVCLPAVDAGGLGPKVEGFFFATDTVGINLLINEGTIFQDHPTKYSAIVFGEYGLSNCIFKHGYSIDCMLKKYEGVDWKDTSNWNKNNFRHPSRSNSFYGESINPFEVIFHK